MPKSRASPDIRAVVDKIVEGKHGLYAVATPEDRTLKRRVGETGITFSLEPKDGVWRGPEPPDEGDIVLLRKVKERRKGYRATEAAPSDL